MARRVIDETGNRYGKWTVIGHAGSRYTAGTWLCQRDCGTTRPVRGTTLRFGGSQSCGCRCKINHFRLPEGEAAFNQLFLNNKAQAKRRGLAWALTKEQFRLLVKQSCHYCGAEPAQIYKKANLNGPCIYNGLDRLDSSMGYIAENVVPCCGTCNIAKHRMAELEFAAWIKQVYNHFARLK